MLIVSSTTTSTDPEIVMRLVLNSSLAFCMVMLNGCMNSALTRDGGQREPPKIVAEMRIDAGRSGDDVVIQFSNRDRIWVCVPWAYLLSGWQDGFVIERADGRSFPERGPDEFVDPKNYVVEFLKIAPNASVSVLTPLSELSSARDFDSAVLVKWQGTAFECPESVQTLLWSELARDSLGKMQMSLSARWEIKPKRPK